MSEDWSTFADRFVEEYFSAHPTFAVSQGRHEFDGFLPDWSDSGLAREIARLRAAAETALAFDPTEMDDRQRTERQHLLAIVDDDLYWLETAEWPRRCPTYYSGRIDPNIYLTRDYAPLPDRMRAFTRWAQHVPDAVSQIRSNLRTPLPRTYIDVGRLSFGGLVSYLENDVPPAFDEVTDAALRSDFRAATADAAEALRGLDAWLADEAARATDEFVLGPSSYREMLRATEQVDVPLERLERLGREDLERNVAALEEACAEYAPGASVAEAIRRIQMNKPSNGPLAAAREQLDGLEDFVRRADLVGIPGDERAEVREAPPHQRWNFAYIDIPGSFERGLPSVYYIAPPDPGWSDEERAAYLPGIADLLFVTVHEVWPGHFLQFLHSNRSASSLARVFVSYALAEGWAHYAEELVWDAGLNDGDPETHIGQLINALLRNVRYLSAIGLHTGTMTVEESERMFREVAHQDAANARQQAARGTFDPAYLNYTLGKLMLTRLRDDWTRSREGRGSWRAFHDEFLSYGGAPIPVIRKAMLGDEGPAL